MKFVKLYIQKEEVRLIIRLEIPLLKGIISMMYGNNFTIESFDAELWEAFEGEKRDKEHIELIVSENYASPRILEAQGSILTNKYAEGIRQEVLRRL